jgi:hypothetical protein
MVKYMVVATTAVEITHKAFLSLIKATKCIPSRKQMATAVATTPKRKSCAGSVDMPSRNATIKTPKTKYEKYVHTA